MSRSPAHLAAISLACLLLPAGLARADLINWSFSWAPSTQTLHATTGTGSITLSSFSGSIQSNSGDLVGLAAASVIFSPGTAPSHFSHAPFSLTLTLTDSTSHQSGSLTFSGAFGGDLSSKPPLSPGVTLHSPTHGSLTLGGNLYDVTIGPYFTLPTPGSPGILLAEVTATSPRTVPEPTTLALAGLSLPVLGLAAWRKRRGREAVAA